MLSRFTLLIFVLTLSFGAFACHGSYVEVLNTHNNGDGTQTFKLYVYMDVGSLDGYAEGFSILFESPSNLTNVVNVSPAYWVNQSNDSLFAFYGNEIGGSEILSFEELENKASTISFETNDGLFGYGAADYSDTIYVTIDGCVDEFLLKSHVTNHSPCEYELDYSNCPTMSPCKCDSISNEYNGCEGKLYASKDLAEIGTAFGDTAAIYKMEDTVFLKQGIPELFCFGYTASANVESVSYRNYININTTNQDNSCFDRKYVAFEENCSDTITIQNIDGNGFMTIEVDSGMNYKLCVEITDDGCLDGDIPSLEMYAYENVSGGSDTISTSIKTLNNSFEMYPNPASDVLSIQFNQVFTGSISVVNLMGQSVISKMVVSALEEQIDVSPLESGVYMITLRSEDQVQTKRIVIE